MEEDLSQWILEAIDMDSYRAEKKATLAIALPNEIAEIEPVPTSSGGRKPEPEMDKLSTIVNEFRAFTARYHTLGHPFVEVGTPG